MKRYLTGIVLTAFVALAACEATNGGNVGGQSAVGGGGNGGAGNHANQGGGGDPNLFGGNPNLGGGGPTNDCDATADQDKDGDGFTINQGDCNDCDANVSPASVEVLTPMDDGMGGAPPAPADEDCDGKVDAEDEDTQPCDSGLAVDDMNPMSGAKAIDLCKVANGPADWGVVNAQWVMANGAPGLADANFHLGHGILSGFGPNVNVQRGERMLAVSSGTARQPSDPGYQSVGGFSKGYSCTHPPGFPKESPSCGVAATGTCYDSTALELTVRVPKNAHGFSFNSNFYTFEWPGYVCTQYNDFFAAILSPVPAGLPDGSIVFDNFGNPVSVNNAFVEVCGCFGGPPCSAGGKTFTCSLGNSYLSGTGFGQDLAGSDHGSTYWLETTAPVDPGTEIIIRYLAYDSGDGVLDSTGLIDNWQWIAEAGTTVGTKPVPEPK